MKGFWMYVKDFDQWSVVKKKLDGSENSVNIRAGEVRWVSVGVNVGSEMDGKGASFTRPCLVLHVIGKHLALVIPCTSKKKQNTQFYLPIETKNFKSYLCLAHIRVVSQKRIFKRVVRLPEKRFESTRDKVFGFYTKELMKK